MTCPQLDHSLFVICFWLVHDLFTSWSWLEHNLFMTYSWVVHDVFMPCSWLVFYLFIIFPLLDHNLFIFVTCYLCMTCSELFISYIIHSFLHVSSIYCSLLVYDSYMTCSWFVKDLFHWYINKFQMHINIFYNSFRTIMNASNIFKYRYWNIL